MLQICSTGSRITRTHDFGFVALDMTHVRDEDEGVYMCRASNALGEAVTTASMRIRGKCKFSFFFTKFIVQINDFTFTNKIVS